MLSRFLSRPHKHELTNKILRVVAQYTVKMVGKNGFFRNVYCYSASRVLQVAEVF